MSHRDAAAGDAAGDAAHRRRHLITGGAGFVGCNLAERLLRSGDEVVILDDLSRPGVERNLAHLQEVGGAGLEVIRAG